MSRPPARRWLAWLAVSAGVVLLDQLSKHLMGQLLGPGGSMRVTPFFDLVLVLNPGAAFSFLSSAAGWQRELFIAIALAASVLIVYLMRKHGAERVFCFALGLILGGAIGNVIDRVQLGAVVDFLHFHLGEYYWPAFNLADSAITCGAGLLIWDSFRRSRVKQAKSGR
ncbi:MAG TPA: signal peptidase II [Burkholderiales bacterium]|nr:signal peptidase II [Burkholderiales bacterium]